MPAAPARESAVPPAEGNPLAVLIILAALVVALAFAALVFMTRQLGILVFVCLAPLVLASLARGGDTSAVKTWAMRLLGLMFAPFALLLISPFVEFAKGSLVVDAVLLVAADALMLRMIFHGVPYFGPKVARGRGPWWNAARTTGSPGRSCGPAHPTSTRRRTPRAAPAPWTLRAAPCRRTAGFCSPPTASGKRSGQGG